MRHGRSASVRLLCMYVYISVDVSPYRWVGHHLHGGKKHIGFLVYLGFVRSVNHYLHSQSYVAAYTASFLIIDL